MDIREIVAAYIQLRDQKAQRKAEFDASIAELDSTLEKMEAVLLKQFDSLGTESMKTAAGTAYISKRSSATVADWDSFLAHVRAKEAFELLERRCSKTAVEQYKAANDDQLPPGVNWSAVRTVNVRR